MKRPLLIGIATLGMLPIGQSRALDIDDSTSALNDRFANNASFIMNDYDLSGVGRSNSGTWATLISQNVFVSANHFHPGTNSTLTFYQANDPNGTSITRTVSGGQRVGDTDIWLGVISEPVPVGYAVYSFATSDINSATDFSNSIYNEQDAFLLGQSPFSNFTGTQDVAAGRNVLDSILLTEGSVVAMRTAIENEGQDVTYEATLVSGDSGAPLFVDFNEADSNYELQLVGTNWFIQPDTGPTTDNGFTYLGNYDTQIQAYIDSHAVPEPSAMAMIGIAMIALATRRRRAV